MFALEQMGEKEVTAIPGIGTVLGERLRKKGFDKAYALLGKFLALKKDEQKFKEWLKDEFGASSDQASNCYSCLIKWSNSNL